MNNLYTLTLNGSIVLFLIVVLLMVLGIVFYYSGIKDDDGSKKRSGFICMLVVPAFLITAASFYSRAETISLQQDAELKLNCGYTAYLDGNVVDADSIDLKQYKISINDITKEIYMTRK